MNHIYRIVWNTATACYQAVSESATGQGKGQGKSTVVQGTAPCTANDWALTATAIGAALCMLSLPSFAGPAGGQVTAGSATITQAGSATTINQTSNRAAIDWTKFSVGANESVRFNQPSASALTLNRVTGTESSAIMGSLSANGQVFILNPNGVLFGAGAQVNVGGLVASTLQMSNANFMAGNYKFAGDAAGSVVNNGNITVAPGGTLALMAPIVQNTGTLSAPGGSVLLAGAQAVTLTLQSNGGLVSYTLDAGSAQALVDNGGLIQAGGGHVVLTAKGVDALSKAVVNHSGVIEAQTVGSKNGVIELLGDMHSGTVNVSGKLDASAPNADGKGGDGGFIDTSAANVQIADTTRVTTAAAAGQTGMWLIDPTDFTINAGGGSLPPSSGIAASTLNASLSITNATIATSAAGTGNGDIFVNSAVDWSANKLTLTAHRNININANLNASGTGKLALNYGQASADGAGSDYILGNGVQVNLPAGQNLSTKKGATGIIKNYTVITTLGEAGSMTATDLQGMNGGLALNYALGSDIDATSTAFWNFGAGFHPIAEPTQTSRSSVIFSGNFDGLGHIVKNVTINSIGRNAVGLFAQAVGSDIRNVGLTDVNINGANTHVGALVGLSIQSSITNSYSTGSVSMNGVIPGSYHVGGLVGHLVFSSNLISSYSTATVSSGGGGVGGLVGYGQGSSISNSYATGSVQGIAGVGGLVGDGGTINKSYATGNVSGSSGVGGLVGYNWSGVSDSYASGAVNSPNGVAGGLVGANFSTITNSYAVGRVTGLMDWRQSSGGLVGSSGSLVINSFWNTETAGISFSRAGTGKTTAEMQQQSTYTGWDFVNTWRIVEGSSYPMLRALTQGKITLNAPARDIEKVYDKTAWSGGSIDYSGFTAGDTSTALQGTLKWVGTAEGAVNAGNYTLVPTGLFSQKYEVVYAPGTLTIQPRPVDVAVVKTYDGNASFTSGFSATNGVLAGDTVHLSGSATVNSANAGSYSTFSSNNLVSSNSNYTANPQYVYTDVLGKVAATIDPAALSLLGVTGSRVYDGTTNANWNDNTRLQDVKESDVGRVYLASGAGLLDGKDVGIRNLSSIGTMKLGGEAAKNYILTKTGSKWTIAPRIIKIDMADGGVLTSNGYHSVENKLYDSTDIAKIHYQISPSLGLNGVNVELDAKFSQKDVGNDIPINIVNMRLTGEDSKNYAFAKDPFTENFRKSLFGNITPQILNVSGIKAELKHGDRLPVRLVECMPCQFYGGDEISGVANLYKEIDGSYTIYQGSLKSPSSNYQIKFQSAHIIYIGADPLLESVRSNHLIVLKNQELGLQNGNFSLINLGFTTLTSGPIDAYMDFMLDGVTGSLGNLRNQFIERVSGLLDTLLDANSLNINNIAIDKSNPDALVDMVNSYSALLQDESRVKIISNLNAGIDGIEGSRDIGGYVSYASSLFNVGGRVTDIGSKFAQTIFENKNAASELTGKLTEWLLIPGSHQNISQLASFLDATDISLKGFLIEVVNGLALDSNKNLDYEAIGNIKDAIFTTIGLAEKSESDVTMAGFLKTSKNETDLLKIMLQSKLTEALFKNGATPEELSRLRYYEIDGTSLKIK